MDTRLLRSFLAVAHLNSFTEAALELRLTQSTVTSHLQKLESQLGTRLLDRLPAGVQVTDAGARLIPRAEDVLNAESNLKALAGHDKGTIAGTVRIVAPESLCTYRLPGVVLALRESAPEIDIWLAPAGIDQAVDEVRRGSADLALTLEPSLRHSELKAERLGREPLVLVGSPDDDSHGDSLTWPELAARDALLIEEGCGYSDSIAASLRQQGGTAGRRSHFGSIEAIKRCAAVGLGWAALPKIAAAEQISSGTLPVLDGPPLPDCDVHALFHPRRDLTPATEAVRQKLRDAWSDASA
ncbi:LysR family transcriptional regulator [Nesterenkonia sp. NBAIMH1]|uniref:LysR family transcriptional regulator n=1 Tax=Nesterenkonia sp. NBAIMH1 TaxID=2600320 RepID=UPI0011B84490|nr:LysR family transcriptional regulator [Nesterenkonia sp. NBAIMH1]